MDPIFGRKSPLTIGHVVVDLKGRGSTSNGEPKETPGRCHEPGRNQSCGQVDWWTTTPQAVPDWNTGGGSKSSRQDHPSVSLLKDVHILLSDLASPDPLLHQSLCAG